jgi:heme/copper-type cytochrome/quinol oxidase subunit 2
MRQDVLGALFVSIVSSIVVLATYRPEKNESRLLVFWTLIASTSVAFVISFAVLYFFFRYSTAAAEMNIIRTHPNF